MKHIRQFSVIFFGAVYILVSGCSVILPEKDEPGLQGHEEYARRCYELAIGYMEEARYELARQQFSFAAASAVSEPLYIKAAEGVRRVDQIIKQKR